MEKNTVYFLVGVPGSGKSTWIINNSLACSLVISSDQVIDAIAAMFDYTYDDIFQDVIKFANKVFFDAVDAASVDCEHEDFPVIIDRTNLSRKSRAPILAKFKNFRRVAVVFPTPEPGEWKRRLAHAWARLFLSTCLITWSRALKCLIRLKALMRLFW